MRASCQQGNVKDPFERGEKVEIRYCKHDTHLYIVSMVHISKFVCIRCVHMYVIYIYIYASEPHSLQCFIHSNSNWCTCREMPARLSRKPHYSHLLYTPWKIDMEPENHLFEKAKRLNQIPNHHFQVPAANLWGVALLDNLGVHIKPSKISHQPTTNVSPPNQPP